MEELNILTSFTAGIASFLSPCVLPLLPVYISYLSTEKDGKSRTSIKLSLGFVFGILTVFVILSLGVKFISSFLLDYRYVISIIGGTVLIIIGLHMVGVLKISIFNSEKRLKFDFENLTFIKAYILGFVYSFSWTPCISPIITGILTLSLTSFDPLSALYILIYGLGFALPFLIVGLLYNYLHSFLKKYQKALFTLEKIMAIVIILVGCYMIYDSAKGIRKLGEATAQSEVKEAETVDFTRADQFGNLHTLSDYRGKYVCLSFVTSWCQYCAAQQEMLSANYDKYDDVVFFMVMSDIYNNDGTDIIEYGKDLAIPILIDDGSLFASFKPYGYPTSYFFGPDGSYVGSINGAMTTKEVLDDILNQVRDKYLKDKE